MMLGRLTPSGRKFRLQQSSTTVATEIGVLLAQYEMTWIQILGHHLVILDKVMGMIGGRNNHHNHHNHLKHKVTTLCLRQVSDMYGAI
jgi:hypothetical protein